MKLILLDRDGVINKDRKDYVKTPEELELIEGVAAAIKQLNEKKVFVAVITNQSCVGKGIISLEQLEEIHKTLQQKLEEQHAKIDKFYVCTDSPENPTFRRKPNPGMLLEALEESGAIAQETFFIGDALRDIQAAVQAGCKPWLVLTGHGQETKQKLPMDLKEIPVSANLLEAVEKIMHEENV